MPRRRKTAAAARLTGSSGQKAGGFVWQPPVNPVRKSASIQRRKGCPSGTSTNDTWGVTLLEAAEGRPVPLALVAVTVKV